MLISLLPALTQTVWQKWALHLPNLNTFVLFAASVLPSIEFPIFLLQVCVLTLGSQVFVLQ